MKRSLFLKLATFSLLAVVAATGCRTKGPKNITPIYGSATRVDPRGSGAGAITNIATTTDPLLDPGAGLRVPPPPRPVTPGNIDIPPNLPPITDRTATGPQIIDGHAVDRLTFAANTIHFDYDRAVLKAAELGKLQPVIAALKAAPQNKLLIEGHCDERGTEEYNRALGERRALAIRTQLIKSGIAPARVTTMSFGEDKPAELGHTEVAWAKNRRGELVLLKPQN